MPYEPQDLAKHNIEQTIGHLQKQGVSKDDLREAILAILEGLK